MGKVEMVEKAKQQEKDNPLLMGLASAGILWWIGTIVLYAPKYMELKTSWPFDIIGYIFITISFVGACLEVGKIWKNKAFEYWGVSLVFLIPALLLHIIVDKVNIVPIVLVKSLILFLIMIGGPFILLGVPYLFERKKESVYEGDDEITIEENRKKKFELSLSLIIAFLSFITAIIKIIPLGK
ncbi:MAG: hypothetical protein ACQET8_02095 [Bacillota bacterium]